MNTDKNIIPPITDPMGQYWRQPDRSEILVDDINALMTEQNESILAEYSATLPSGKYAGKMWRARNPNAGPKWVLGWYCTSNLPGMIGIQWRPILTVSDK